MLFQIRRLAFRLVNHNGIKTLISEGGGDQMFDTGPGSRHLTIVIPKLHTSDLTSYPSFTE